MNEQNEPKRAGEILADSGLEERFAALIKDAPTERPPEPPKPDAPRVLNESFFPEYREEWDVDPGIEFLNHLNTTRQIVRDGGIGILIGSQGTGKTRLMAETARSTRPRGSKYLKTSKLFRMVRATYSSKFKTEDDVVEELTRVPVLFLDEFDKRSETPNENALLFSVIDDRFDLGRPTIIAGNIPAPELGKRIDPAILDRVKQGGGLVLFSGKSHR